MKYEDMLKDINKAVKLEEKANKWKKEGELPPVAEISKELGIPPTKVKQFKRDFGIDNLKHKPPAHWKNIKNKSKEHKEQKKEEKMTEEKRNEGVNTNEIASKVANEIRQALEDRFKQIEERFKQVEQKVEPIHKKIEEEEEQKRKQQEQQKIEEIKKQGQEEYAKKIIEYCKLNPDDPKCKPDVLPETLKDLIEKKTETPDTEIVMKCFIDPDNPVCKEVKEKVDKDENIRKQIATNLGLKPFRSWDEILSYEENVKTLTKRLQEDKELREKILKDIDVEEKKSSFPF